MSGAEPDGTTLRSCPTPALSIGPYKDLPSDPAKFVPITVYAMLPGAPVSGWSRFPEPAWLRQKEASA